MADQFVNEPGRVGVEIPLALPPTPVVVAPAAASPREPSYYATNWAVVNRALALVDEVSGGRAGVVQRAFTYLCIGGFAAVVNLLLYTFLASVVNLPFLVAQLIASEISIFANFIPNDRITFSHLPGHQRSWGARCLRFHVTSIAGTIVTICVSWALQQFIFTPQVIAQATLAHLISQGIAIWIALIFNFTFHHLFTYGGHAAADTPAPAIAAAPVSMQTWAHMYPPSHE